MNQLMKVTLKCPTKINDQKVPGKVTIKVDKKDTEQATCIELEEQQARALINSQHARLAKANETVNFSLEKQKVEK